MKIGIIGGGQLAMMAIKYNNYQNGQFKIIDPNPNCPASKYADELIVGSLYDDNLLINDFAHDCDVITIEIEHFSTRAYREIHKRYSKIKMIPEPDIIDIICNKSNQFSHIKAKFPEVVPDFFTCDKDILFKELVEQMKTSNKLLSNTEDSLSTNSVEFVAKLSKGGYDGKGVIVYSSESESESESNQDSYQTRLNKILNMKDWVIQRRLKHITEVSLVVLILGGRALFYPIVEMVMDSELNLLSHMKQFNLNDPVLDNQVKQEIYVTAKKILKALGYFYIEEGDKKWIWGEVIDSQVDIGTAPVLKGIFSIEMMIEWEDEQKQVFKGVYLNEIAPRLHNSCHHTIDLYKNYSCYAKWIEILREDYREFAKFPIYSAAKSNKKLNSNPNANPNANANPNWILYNLIGPKHLEQPYQITIDHNMNCNYRIEDYGKTVTRPGRKLGHIFIKHQSSDFSLNMIQVKPLNTTLSFPTLVFNSKTIKRNLKIGRWLKINANSESKPESNPESNPVSKYYRYVTAPKIGLIMGSTSDWKIVKDTAQLLVDLDIPFERTVVSAHRTPERLREYAKSAYERGLEVIITAAGGAAHLPGMIAAWTSLPVIGIPIKTSNLSGVDSLYSIVQMPPGVPVATVAINGAINAAILALQIIGEYRVASELKATQNKRVSATALELKLF